MPLKFVCEHGKCLYKDGKPLDLEAASAFRRQRTKDSANRRKAKAGAIADLKRDPTAGDTPVAVMRKRGEKAK